MFSKRVNGKSQLIISLLVLSVVTTACADDAIQLAANRISDYQVVVANKPSVEANAAAWELASFLELVTEAYVPVVPVSRAKPDYQIIVGRSQALEDLKLSIDWEALGPEGFIIRTVGRKLVIAGGSCRGTINGVYTFLEDVVGCRWYTPTFSVIPRKQTLSIPPLDVQKVPVFESRFVFCGAATDVDWAARQRLNTFTRDVAMVTKPDGSRVVWNEFINDPKLTGCYYYAQRQVHTLWHNGLLPYAMFDEHPEYFALVDGKRLREGQLCLTNPDLVRIIADGAKAWLQREPTAKIISISQGDYFHDACQCPRCKAAYEEYGLSGATLNFVNQVAAEIEKYDPEILVSTLAYKWTRKPPKVVVPRKNVVIRYAPINACYRHAYDDQTCRINREKNFYGDLVEWIRISPRVWVWYYSLPEHELHPYPNLKCLSRNFRRMRDAGVKGFIIWTLFSSTPARTGGLLDLKAYLFAKLMWDPDYDVSKGIEEFVTACYGAAAPQVLEYIERIDDENTYDIERYDKEDTYAIDENENTYIQKTPGEFHFGCGYRLFFKKGKLAELDALFDQAEQTVAEDPGALWRLKLVRLSLQDAIILQADKDDPIRQKAVRDFFAMIKQANILPPDYIKEENR